MKILLIFAPFLYGNFVAKSVDLIKTKPDNGLLETSLITNRVVQNKTEVVSDSRQKQKAAMGGAAALAGYLVTMTSLSSAMKEMTRNSYSVAGMVQFDNFGKYFLENKGPNYQYYGNAVSTPGLIKPGSSAGFFSRKAMGTAGVTQYTSWEIEGTGWYVAVFFSLPWNQNHHGNWLTLGAFKSSSARKFRNRNKVYDLFYGAYRRSYRNQYTTKKHDYVLGLKEFYYNTDAITIKFTDSRGVCWRFEGAMGSAHQSEISLLLIPCYYQDYRGFPYLAKNLQNLGITLIRQV